jgi:hypothetical protein
MNRRVLLLASLISTHFAMWGADAMIAAHAEDAPPISSAKGAEVQHQPGTGAGGSSPNTGVDTTTFGKNDSDSLGGAAVKAHGKSNSADNPAKVDAAGSNPGDHQTGPRDAAGEKETDGKDARHGDSHTRADHSGTEAAPIDTRITIVGRPRSWRWSKAHDWKKSKVAGTSANLRYGLNSARRTKGAVVRNAIGLAVEAGKPAINDSPKSTTPLGKGETQAGTTDFHHEGLTSAVRPHDPPISTAMNHSIVDGRDLVRAGSGAGAVGGRTKSSAGVISGTGFQIRHP